MLSVRCPVCLSVLSVCDIGVSWPNGWTDQDETWHAGIGLGPGHIVLDGDPAHPPQKGAQSPQFSAHICCGQTAGWIKMPLGTEVDLSPGHIVLDGDPAPLPRERGTAAALFSAHVYCGHGRPSQLLLSSCSLCYKMHDFANQLNMNRKKN